MERLWFLACVAVATLVPSSASEAQNVTGYGNMSEPLLFLLREPAVHDDLALTQTQIARLEELNHSLDGRLLASRNMSANESQAEVNHVLTTTREQLSRILTHTQQTRIQQVKYRLRGISCVQLPEVAEQLRLSANQKQKIDKIIEETQKIVKENSSATFQGNDAYKEALDAITAARKAEQQEILAVLEQRQTQQLFALVGKPFDLSRLGKVSFKAPDFAQGDQWLNSRPLKLNDLRGKVVALHFYAFG